MERFRNFIETSRSKFQNIPPTKARMLKEGTIYASILAGGIGYGVGLFALSDHNPGLANFLAGLVLVVSGVNLIDAVGKYIDPRNFSL